MTRQKANGIVCHALRYSEGRGLVPARPSEYLRAWHTELAFCLLPFLPLPATALLATADPASEAPIIARLKGHKHTITCLAFSAIGNCLASGSKDGTVILWDVARRKILATLPGHKDMVTVVAFTPDGKTLASGSHDNRVRLWDVAIGKELEPLRGHERTCAAWP